MTAQLRRTRRVLYTALITLGSLTTTIWYATVRGQDFNWDQQNYHISIPFLLAHGTFWDSIVPAGNPSFFNPYVLQLQFVALQHLGAINFAIMLAVVQSLAFIIAGLICGELGRVTESWWAMALSLAGFALCLLAPMSLSEAGTTFIDLVTAIPVLAAYALLLVRGRWLGLVVSGLLAGGLLGAATALKLTNGVFALGVVGFMLAGPDTSRQRLGWLLACGTAAVLGFAVVGGSWHLGLWQRFGNPVFPYFNNIFLSRDYNLTALRDVRYLSHSVLDVWRYPLYWLLGGSPTVGIATPSSEVPFIDARWIVFAVTGTLFLAALPIFRRWGATRLGESATGLFLTFVIDYLVWLALFGYHRYMLPLDILCGAMVLFLAWQIGPWLPRLVLMLAMGLVSWQMLRVPDWGHLPWKPYWQAINFKPLDFGGASIVFLTTMPSSYIAASLPPNTRYVALSVDFNLFAGNNTSLTRQIQQELTTSPEMLLKEVDKGSVSSVSAAILASYGLTVTARCRELKVAVETFRICDVERQPGWSHPR